MDNSPVWDDVLARIPFRQADIDPYVAAATDAGARVQYLRDDYGDHGFGLKRFWAAPCANWLAALGVGVPDRGQEEDGA